MTLPVYSTDQIADQLVHGYWDAKNGGNWRAFDVGPGGIIDVNITALNAVGTTLARAALEAWENVIDVQFNEVAVGGDLTFNHASGGAIGGHSYSGNTITSAFVRISTGWFNSNNGTEIGSYSMQTFMHEIGHALGLGHAGNYDGGGSYGTDNHYVNESWQMTIMSYFDQKENTWVNADKAVAATLMPADVVAAQSLYGASQAQAGNTIYGANSNVGGALEQILNGDFNNGTPGTTNAFTLFDSGGIDRLEFKHETADQRIDLNAEAISDIGGKVGNLIIARDTMIEEAWGGWGDDEIIGNTADNWISGGRGHDTLSGGEGQDRLYGRSGNDLILGEDGPDRLKGGDGNDSVDGGAGKDVVIGEDGDDSLSGGQDLDRMNGGRGNDTLSGGEGQDRLYGRLGNDLLLGEDGHDRLKGDSGNDTLDGGLDNDMLTGGDDADVFIFAHGTDVILDFQDDIDTLWLDDALWGGGMSEQEVIDAFAVPVTGGTLLDFPSWMTLELVGVSDANLLVNDLAFV